MRKPATVFAGAALLTSLAALAADCPPVRIGSLAVEVPKNPSWRSAHAEVRYNAERMGAHSSHGDWVDHVVVVDAPDGGRANVPLLSCCDSPSGAGFLGRADNLGVSESPHNPGTV